MSGGTLDAGIEVRPRDEGAPRHWAGGGSVNSLSWPFEAPRNVAVVTVRQILNGGAPIRMVCHDAADGGWQFLTGEPIDISDAMLVALEEIARHDPSVLQLADLPEGWKATRDAAADAWVRRPSPSSDE